MKRILLLVLIFLFHNSFGQSIEVKKNNNRYDVYKGDTLLGTLKHKSTFPRFELSLYAGESFYGLPNSSEKTVIISGNKYGFATTGSSSFKLDAALSYFVSKRIDIGGFFSRTNYGYNATTPTGSNKFFGFYINPSDNYGLFSDYYFHVNKLNPFVGICIAYQQDHYTDPLPIEKYHTYGVCGGVHLGLKYEIVRHFYISIIEQVYVCESYETSAYKRLIKSYSTLGGLSFRF